MAEKEGRRGRGAEARRRFGIGSKEEEEVGGRGLLGDILVGQTQMHL